MKSILGWILLLVALAVPAVFFYNWWTKMNTPEQPSLGIVRKKGSSFGKVNSGAPPNPIEEKTEVASTTSTIAAAASPKPEGEAMPAGIPVTHLRTGGNEPVEKKPSIKRGAETLEYAPNTNRDPTLSIMDHKMLAILREQRLDALKPKVEVKPKKENKPKPVVKKPSIASQITVQGIISTPNGRAAIVNDEVRYVGDAVLGAVIKKVTSSTVIFNFKGRTFYKRMQ